MKISAYPVNYKVVGFGDDRFHSFEFYILPMLRYQNQGENSKFIQFRWLVWGINIYL